MPNTIRFFRDSLTIDQDLIATLGAQPADTIVFGARQVNLSALSPLFDYVIAADEVTVQPAAGTALKGENANASPDVTVLAATITGALQITCSGGDGEDGADGLDGDSGIIDDPDSSPGKPPPAVPGGDGGNGGNGGNGAPGGTITVHFTSAAQAPTGSAPGGVGGKGGRGGAAGAGRPPGKPGRAGRDGADAGPGVVKIRQVPVEDVWKALDPASAEGWAAYRDEVAGFFFRKFDAESQLTALSETEAALRLNPQDAEAATIRSRIVNRQIPSGLARDLDIAPDFPELAANLVAEIGVVHDAFQSYEGVTQLALIERSIRENLTAIRLQLVDRRTEAQADVAIAEQDVEIAKAEKANLQAQVDQVRKDIDAAANKSFSFGDMISDVATIAGAVAGIATGVGAIISIPAGLAALKNVIDGPDSELWLLLGTLNNAAKDPKHPTTNEYDIAHANQLGGDLKDLLEGAKSTTSFLKLIADLDDASTRSGQGEIGKLLKQQAVLVRQQMVASLRERQAHSRVAVANLRLNNLTAEIAEIQQRIDHWSVEEAALVLATDLLIRAARGVVDIVMDDVFLAQRAREIYELDGLPDLRFDFGYLHPDRDHGLSPALRASEALTSLSGLAPQVLSWNQIFQRLNTAQIGFDVIHPRLSLTIGDQAQLRAFANGAALDFSVAMSDLPSDMFELKLNAVGVELEGASSSQAANIWITHSGEWSLNRRTDGSVTAISLRPRSEVLAIAAATGTLTANIPTHPQSNSETGPPFSFWGRGVVTTMSLQLAEPSPIDLGQLSRIDITLDCLAFARQGGPSLLTVTTIEPKVQLNGVMPVVAGTTPATV
jgi:hypothetical protein